MPGIENGRLARASLADPTVCLKTQNASQIRQTDSAPGYLRAQGLKLRVLLLLRLGALGGQDRLPLGGPRSLNARKISRPSSRGKDSPQCYQVQQIAAN